MFVPLSNGPGPFADILQAQRFNAGLQQQGFQNELGVQQMIEQREQRAIDNQQTDRQLDIAEQRNSLIRQQSNQRIVGRAQDYARSRGVPYDRQAIGRIGQRIGGVDPEWMQGRLETFQQELEAAGFSEDSDEGEIWRTPQAAQLVTDLLERDQAIELAQVGQMSAQLGRTMEALVADERTGLRPEDMAEVAKALESESLTPAAIRALETGLKRKAAESIGFHESKKVVLNEAQSLLPQFVTGAAARGGGMADLSSRDRAAELQALAGQMETATTREELMSARSEYLILGYGLDDKFDEVEQRAFSAGRAAAEAAYSTGFRGGRVEQPMGPQAGAGAGVSADEIPNLMGAAEAEVDETNRPLSAPSGQSSIAAASFEVQDSIARKLNDAWIDAGSLRGERGGAERRQAVLQEVAKFLVNDMGFAEDDALYEFLAREEAKFMDALGEKAAGKEAKSKVSGARIRKSLSDLVDLLPKGNPNPDPLKGRR